MGASCEFIPNIKGEPSKLFKDLLTITKNRKEAAKIYALATNSRVQKVLNLNSKDSLGEPTASSIIDSIGNPAYLLGRESYKNYINMKENLSNDIKNYTEAVNKVETLLNKYKDYAFNVYVYNDSYRISISDKELGFDNMKKSIFRGRLQNKLLGIMRGLGFDIAENSTVNNTSRFSPINAEENAEGLKTVIQIAKGEKGEKDFIEEFAHLMIEGLHSHPLVQRLLDKIDNNKIKEVLQEDYEKYKSKYKNNEGLLKKEAAGKILAKAILEHNYDTLSNRIYNVAKDRLAKGNTNNINRAIREAEDEAYDLVGVLEDPEINVIFDKKAVMKAKTLYSLNKEVGELEALANKAYEMIQKKIKITTVRSKKRQMSEEEERVLDKMYTSLRKKDYSSSCFSFLKFVLDDVQKQYDKIEDFNNTYDKKKGLPLHKIRHSFRILRDISTSITAYEDIIKAFVSINNVPNITEVLAEEDIELLQEKAEQIQTVYTQLLDIYKSARKNTIFEFYSYYWGKDKVVKLMNGSKEYSLNDILDMAPQDINVISSLFNSMEDASDPLLAITDNIFKKVMHERDEIIVETNAKIKSAHEDYVKATGSRDTSFMYEKDEEGNLTGMLISKIDYQKYYKEKRELIQKYKNEGKSREFIAAKVKEFNSKNLKQEKTADGNIVYIPNPDKYKSEALNSLTKEQREYYDKMIVLKQALDSLIPSRYTNPYKAVQKRASGTDAVFNTLKNTPKALKEMQGAFVDAFTATESDTEFGEILDENGNIIDADTNRRILLDFAGNPVSKVPVYYTSRIKDTSYLSTDFTDSLMAYAAMAINYNQIQKVADAFEVIKEHVAERPVAQTIGKTKLSERFIGSKGEEFTNPYLKKGKDTNIYKAFSDYVDRNIYGKTKKEEVLYIGKNKKNEDITLNYGKVGDTLKWYTTLVGMGYNIFSFGSNITMGTSQLLIEAVGNLGIENKHSFTLKNLSKAIKVYFQNLPEIMADKYRDNPKNKISLLLQKFDPSEDIYSSTKDTNTARGVISRTLSLFSPLSGMSAGEHYLHTVIMLACLDNIKTSNNESLLDSYEINDSESYNKLKLSSNIKIDGKEITEDTIFDIKRSIQTTSHKINGAYSDVDKGSINNQVLGRFLMQYRQWIPAYLMNRFKTQRYNAATGQQEEGFYNTLFSYSSKVILDALHCKFTIATRYKQLTDYQKYNLNKALFELSLYTTLAILLNGDKEPDKKDSFTINYIKYMGYRLKLELGAFSPTPELAENVMDLFNSPIPALEKVDYIINLFMFGDLNSTIESGKFKGWNRYTRNLYYAMPFARNIGRAKELYEGNFDMFKVYMQN